jgi:tetratricopeptide (TPR) repeat protein
VSAEQIRAEAQAAEELPAGHAKAQRFEALAERARECDDRWLEAVVLLRLSDAYALAAEHHKHPAVFGRVLWLFDNFPDEVGPLSHNVHWQLKWMTGGLLANPDVPLEVTYNWFGELERRYRQRGHSLRPVHALRSCLASEIGDHATASAQMEAAIAAPRDEMADCQACEHSDWGRWRAELGDDEGALSYWAPVLDGELKCREEPHFVFGKAALPLLRTGRAGEARRAFLAGYSLAKQKVSLASAIGRHIEFCALTGNEARGLEILAEHQGWLADREMSAAKRLEFLGGVAVLLRRLTVLGHDSLPVGSAHTVASLSAALDEELREICGRYDARNGSSVVSERVSERLRREPLADQFPLGLPARLPRSAAAAAAGAAAGAAADPAVQGTQPARRATAAQAAAGASLDELIARARELAERRHPGAGDAWARAAATAAADGRELPGDVAATVARFSAGRLLRTDLAAGQAAMLAAAGRFAELGDLDGELESRAVAAHARYLTGDAAGGRAALDAVRAEATAAFAAGKMTPRYYLNVVLVELALSGGALETASERSAADIEGFVSGLESALAVAEQHGDAYHTGQCRELLSRAAFWRGDQDAAARHLTAARESFHAAATPWAAVQAEAGLAELALMAGDPQQAESCARDALAHAIDPPASQAAMLASLRAEALSRIPERAAEFADACLTAAARWDGISEPDVLHNTFNAARAYARLGRHAEAAALFAEAMPKVNVPYDQAGITQTRIDYARSLRAIERHQEAAEQFLEAARLIADDPAGAETHAFVAADAARELQESGQDAAALAAFSRAAELFRAVGNTVARVRCQRSAAWVQFALGDEGRRSGITTMRSVLGELESLTEGGSAAAAPASASASASAELAVERENTVKQLDRMLTMAAEAGDAVG